MTTRADALLVPFSREKHQMTPLILRDRWVLVTGASSGLGQEIARVLAHRHGANLVVVARRADRLEVLRKKLEAEAGVKVAPITADLSRMEDVDRLFQHATDGRSLSGAVLNAGVTHFGDHDELSWNEFDAMLSTNVRSIVRMSRELIPHLEAQSEGGGLMLVSSLAGLTPVPYQTAYSATKAFLVHYGCGLSHELNGRNVSITTFAPGGIITEMTAGARFDKLRSFLMPVDVCATEAVEAFRRRDYLAIPGLSNRIGTTLMRFLPQRFLTGRVAATYRKSLGASRAAGTKSG